MKALSISKLEKTYATGIQAVKGISLDIEEGDFFALLGPNGAGKTTIIGITAGLVNKTGGTVRVFGRDIDQSGDEAKSFIGLVPQEINFNIFEKVINIVVDQAGFYGIPRSTALKDAEKYLKQLGLWEKRNERSMTLSGGMKRRLLIARALIHHPKLLILDEPTAGVDIELRRGMWDFLQDLTKEKGTTIILTTHYLEEAEQLCKNVAIINKGEIVKQGSMSKVLSELNQETFILYLKKPIENGSFEAARRFQPVRVDEKTIEVTVKDGETLSQLIAALAENQVEVLSMRTKSNRLEQIFVGLTSQ